MLVLYEVSLLVYLTHAVRRTHVSHASLEIVITENKVVFVSNLFVNYC